MLITKKRAYIPQDVSDQIYLLRDLSTAKAHEYAGRARACGLARKAASQVTDRKDFMSISAYIHIMASDKVDRHIRITERR